MRHPRLRAAMSDERNQPPELIATGFAALVEGLRSDVREDIRDLRTELGAVEGRMTARVASIEVKQAESRKLIEEFAGAHGEMHEAEAAERRAAHSDFYNYIRSAELDRARRDGALGVVRYGVELVSKHAGRLVQVILATAALLGIATGAIEVGVR